MTHAMLMNSERTTHAGIAEEFARVVGSGDYPCLAGRGVVHGDRHILGVYGTLGSHRSARMLERDLTAFLASADEGDDGFRAFVAVFPRRAPRDELEFETRLWTQLQRLHDADPHRSDWARGTSDDPDDPRFAFSFAGHALFVIGLHEHSSRVARRLPWPTLVFNPRRQFEQLREKGHFERMQAAVREREVALQGSINPNLADFGERSEAAQYSGRATEREWRCPFHRTS